MFLGPSERFIDTKLGREGRDFTNDVNDDKLTSEILF